VGLRGLELQARSSIEPVTVTAPMLQARAHRAGAKVTSDAANQTNTAGVVPSALILRSNIAEPQRHCREKAGNPRRLERYRRQFPGAKGAPRSCPAGSIAVAGLRRCGGPREPNGVAATAWRHGGDIDWSIGNVRLVRYIIWTPSQYVIGATVELLTPRFAVWCFRRWCHARTSSCVQGNDARPPRRVGRLRRAGGSGATENSIGAFKQTQTPAPVC
jgi:hypothetical protein